MEKKEIKTYLDQGYLLLDVIFEIVGNPKSYVTEAMDLVMKKVSESKNIKVVSQEIAEPADVGEGLWGTHCATALLIKDVFTVSALIFTFIPSSIEVREPAKITLKDKELSDFFSDIATQLHQTNTKLIQVNSNNMTMLRNINALMRNMILIAIREQDKTITELSKLVGITSSDLEPLLEAMIKEKTIEKKGNKYAKVQKK
jgi:hypothetical protein